MKLKREKTIEQHNGQINKFNKSREANKFSFHGARRVRKKHTHNVYENSIKSFIKYLANLRRPRIHTIVRARDEKHKKKLNLNR